jgi:autotransporter adhesin
MPVGVSPAGAVVLVAAAGAVVLVAAAGAVVLVAAAGAVVAVGVAGSAPHDASSIEEMTTRTNNVKFFRLIASSFDLSIRSI